MFVFNKLTVVHFFNFTVEEFREKVGNENSVNAQ